MIEPIMFFGIGFLVASLFGLVLIPLVHNRAVRLTMRRLEAATPLSMAEIQADKDQLRAEFAMSTRRLELSVEQMKAKTTSQLAELGKKTDAINRLKVELGEKTAAIFALEAREKALKDQLQATEGRALGQDRRAARGRAHARRQGRRSSPSSPPTSTKAVTADSQRVELVALRAQVEALKDGVNTHEREAQEIGDRLDRERKDATAATNELDEERGQGREARRSRDAARARAGRADDRGRGSRPAASQELESAASPNRCASLPSARTKTPSCATKSRPRRRPKPTCAPRSQRPRARSRATTESLRKEKALIEDQLDQLEGRAHQARSRKSPA